MVGRLARSGYRVPAVAVAAGLVACAVGPAPAAEGVQYRFGAIAVPAASADEPRRDAVSLAMMMSHSMATSQPPPSA